MQAGLTTKCDGGYSTKVVASGYRDEDYDKPDPEALPCYSVGRIPLPLLNSDLTCDTILMWEAVSVKTEVLGIGAMVNMHSQHKALTADKYYPPGIPIEGLNMHMFAVGGQPLDLVSIVQNRATVYDQEKLIVPPEADLCEVMSNAPTTRALLTEDAKYPVEVWSPDPSKNENSRYFGTYTGGTSTPPVLQFTNTTTTLLLDENGVGPLCKGDGLYLSAIDIAGLSWTLDLDGYFVIKYRGLPRYFNVTLRKRVVKNPYPVNALLSSIFNCQLPAVHGQPMEGTEGQVEEVRVYDGTEPLPGDPTLNRIAYGCCTKTVFPGN